MRTRRFALLVTLSLAALAFAATLSFAQAPQDFSKVEIKTTKVTNNFYTLEGSGGMIGILTGPDGVFMVDAQYAQLTDKILAAVKKVSDKPVRFMVNTHVHPDHTSGAENLAKAGVTILSRPQLRDRLAHPNPGANGQPGTPAPAGALATITYDAPTTLHMNGEEIQLIPIRAAHTDGDTLVHFVNNDVIMTGDFYRSLGYPNIDRANGGSLRGMLDGLAQVVAMAGPKTKIIPGHGDTVDRTAVQWHRDMMLAVRDNVAKLEAQGKSQADVVAAKPTAEFDAKVPSASTTSERFIGQVYAELKAVK